MSKIVDFSSKFNKKKEQQERNEDDFAYAAVDSILDESEEYFDYCMVIGLLNGKAIVAANLDDDETLNALLDYAKEQVNQGEVK